MMTMVMDVTTEAVVPSPRLWVLGLTRRPQWQPIRAMSTPNTTDLATASPRLPTFTAAGRACTK